MKRIILTFLLMSLPVIILLTVLNRYDLGNEIVYIRQVENKEINKAEELITERLVKPDDVITVLKNIDNSGRIFGENKEGSAIALQGRTGIVTFYASDDTTTWNKTEIIEVQNRINIACEWLKAQTESFGYSCDFVCNKKDMMYFESYSSIISTLNTDQQYREVCKWINDDADSEKLLDKYDLDSLIYLVILNISGTSYAVPHYVEDGLLNYYECCFMYLYDSEQPDIYETPAAFAHEMLHLFGAVDLYGKGNYNYGVSDILADYIRENYPNDIMFTTYENGYISNQNEITNKISRITAYELGLIEKAQETSVFPELIKADKYCQYKNY